MTGRSAEATNNGGDERRGPGHRVHFEALVAVGGEGGGGFDAESVDMSPEGMRLRAAYLPELGEKLVCRFDGPGVEILAEGEVAWRTEESQGGEFGMRFTNLDEGAVEAVRAMCKPEGEPADPAAVPTGTRVRLHIEGLASPMKARVRESHPRELLVGSNLEFLKVGRPLELEDVDHGARREAFVDHVKIELDPQSNVPQLVVSLRYDAAKSSAAPTSQKSASPSQKERALDTVMASSAKSSAARAEESSDDEAEDEIPRGAAAMAFAKVTKAGMTAGSKVGPALAFASGRTKDAVLGLIAAVQRKRVERAEAKRAQEPRRMTAPAPAGGLHSEGRKLVRDDGEIEEVAPAPRINKRAALVGSAIGLIAVISVIGISHGFGHRAAKPETASTTAAALPALDGAAAAASGSPVANVPLFGATPLSTTEAVPPPSASAVASAAPDAPPAVDGDAEKGELVKEWGQGKVVHATVIKIKMDGPLDGVIGASGAMGFTLSVPNHRSLTTATDLARKDKRLASVKIVNTSQGAEVTVQFKDGVPPYIARVKGDRLEIALGDGGHKTIAKKKTKKKK